MNDQNEQEQSACAVRHWRCQSRQAIALEQVRRLGFDGKRIADILDIGYGELNLASALSAIGDVDAVDLGGDGGVTVRTCGGQRRTGKRYDLIVALDVIGRVDDDAEAIGEMCSLLRPGGKLVISAAAHRLLDNDHDLLDGGRRRYSLWQLRRMLRGFGEVRRIRYIHGLACPVDFLGAMAGRLGLRMGNWTGEQANQFMTDLMMAEYKATRYLPLMTGSAIMAVLSKPVDVRSSRVVMSHSLAVHPPMLRVAA